MKILNFFLLIALLSVASAAWASTYYIDYGNGNDSNNGTSKSTPWKHHPFMKGFAGSYSHHTGDTFVFKGGVMWPYSPSDPMYPWIIKFGGACGRPDKYTVDKSWHAGTLWMPPIFDGCQTGEALNACALNGASTLGPQNYLIGDNGNVVSNIVINGLQFQNIGYPVSGTQRGSGETMLFNGGGSNMTVENCVLIPHALEAFEIDVNWNRAGQTASQIYIHDNQISYAGRGVIYAFPGGTVNLDDVRVYKNKWQGPGSVLDATLNNDGYHLDGLMIGNPAEPQNTQLTMSNVLFYGNDFYGEWGGAPELTAQFFSLGGINNLSIYNNVFSIEQTGSDGFTAPMYPFVEFGSGGTFGNLNIYNNTFSSDSEVNSTYGVNYGIYFVGSNTTHPVYINIKNNIFSGVEIGTEFNTGSTWTSLNSNYNLYNINGGSYIKLDGSWLYNTSLSSACSGKGLECNSLGSNSYSSTYPKFVALSNGNNGSEDLDVQSGSPAIGAGTNLSSIFTTDIKGATRPSTGGWTMAAYEYNTVSTSTSYTVTPSAGSGGTISPSTPQTVSYDGTTSFTVTPDSGYSISSVTGCGGTLSGSTYTTGPITSNCTVTASFAAAATTTTTTTYTLAVTDTGTGSGVVTSSPTGISCGFNCSETVSSGTSVTLAATPNSGSSFAGWSGGGCSGTGNCTIDLTANTTVSAAFTANTTSTTNSISVTSPSGGQILYTGSRYNIAWTYSGNPGSSVNIYLLNNGSVVRTIATGASIGSNGSGSYSWRIPKPVKNGTNYSIMVTSASNSNYTSTSGSFSIL